MRHQYIFAALLGCGLLLGGNAVARQPAAAPVTTPNHDFFHIQLGAHETTATSGRLLLFAIDAKDAEAATKDGKVDDVDTSPFFPTQTSVAAREVSQLVPGQVIDIDADHTAFPAGWSSLPPGDYYVQAVLDVNHDYNYTGRGAGDLISSVVKMHLPASSIPTLDLDKTLPAHDPWVLSSRAPDALRKALPVARQHARLIVDTRNTLPQQALLPEKLPAVA